MELIISFCEEIKFHLKIQFQILKLLHEMYCRTKCEQTSQMLVKNLTHRFKPISEQDTVLEKRPIRLEYGCCTRNVKIDNHTKVFERMANL